MPVVKFDMEDEFCEDLEKDADKVDRKIVRITNLFRTSLVSSNIRHVLVVATYSVAGQVVRLERYCGDVWGVNAENDDEILLKAERIHEAVGATCGRCGLEVRRGSLVTNPIWF